MWMANVRTLGWMLHDRSASGWVNCRLQYLAIGLFSHLYLPEHAVRESVTTCRPVYCRRPVWWQLQTYVRDWRPVRATYSWPNWTQLPIREHVLAPERVYRDRMFLDYTQLNPPGLTLSDQLFLWISNPELVHFGPHCLASWRIR